MDGYILDVSVQITSCVTAETWKLQQGLVQVVAKEALGGIFVKFKD